MQSELFSFIFLLCQEIPDTKTLNPDIPIKDIYEELVFDQLDFIIGVIKFGMHHGVEIPDELAGDDSQTLRQFISKVSELPRVSDEDFVEFIESNKALLAKAIEHREELLLKLLKHKEDMDIQIRRN